MVRIPRGIMQRNSDNYTIQVIDEMMVVVNDSVVGKYYKSSTNGSMPSTGASIN